MESETVPVYLTFDELGDLLSHVDDSRHAGTDDEALISKLEEAQDFLLVRRAKEWEY